MSLYTADRGYHKNRPWKLRLTLLVTVICLAVFGYIKLVHSKPTIEANIEISPPAAATAAPQPKLTTPVEWPKYGQAAYGVAGTGVLAASDENAQPVPIASLAKVVTALAVLKEKPLKPGEQGPVITLNEQDIASYREYMAKNGAVVPIEIGEQITQYQVMQAMLMSSANNMSDTLARWAFGSIEQYNEYANKMVKELGLAKTTVADASGFSPQTKSTAPEIVQLGIFYMENPILREIASQQQAQIPFAGPINNYNSVINKDGILGLKVGNTDEAGKCFLVADMRGGPSNTVSVVAIVGAPNLDVAMSDAKTVLNNGNKGYEQLSGN